MADEVIAINESSPDEMHSKRASKGGQSRMKKMSPDQRRELAKLGAAKRWGSKKTAVAEIDAAGVPKAKLWAELQIGEKSLPCYHLDNDVRVFSLKGIVVSLMGTEGGQLAEYIKVRSLRPYLSNDLVPAENDQIPALIRFDTGSEGFTQFALGLPVEKFIDLCDAYSQAAEVAGNLTERQRSIAVTANAFLRACAKVGIVALVDEATGYQAQRPLDELQMKLKLFLAEEMRKWERTFPEELWVQFGRLTHWKGTIHQRPKYWGKLVMELIYEYLDPDVAQWLRENKPKPSKGQNYHQWLSEQYGLKKLIEHIWKVIGVASVCQDMPELRKKMEELYGRREGFQFALRLTGPQTQP